MNELWGSGSSECRLLVTRLGGLDVFFETRFLKPDEKIRETNEAETVNVGKPQKLTDRR